MSEAYNDTCPACGAALNPHGVCNRCMFLDACDGDPTTAFSLPGLGELEEIARGGMGVVYKAKETVTGRVVAVKVPVTRMWEDEEAMRRFAQEVRSAALLDHPHVLPVLEVGRSAHAPFFTMKFAAGGSLADQARAHRDEADYFAWIARTLAKVADAVQFAHERGVLHRDLKPANILFDEAGEPYVADFGLAKWLEGSALGETELLTRTITSLGTPHYLAPEIAGGRSPAAAIGTDVYALGAILYELLCGRPPHEGASITLVLRKVADERPQAPSKFAARPPPRDLEAVCLKAMEMEPADRYAGAAMLATDLRHFLAGEAVVARPLPFAQRSWRWMRKHPGIAALGAALIIVLASSAAMILSANRKLSLTLDASERNLRDALIAQSRFVRRSMQAGQRSGALQLLLQARERGGASVELRSEAAAALAAPEMRNAGVAFEFTSTLHLGAEVALTPDFTKALLIRRSDRRVVLQKLDDGSVLWMWSGTDRRLPDAFQLSESAQYAALIFPDHAVEVWDTRANALRYATLLFPSREQSAYYTPTRPFHLHPRLPYIAGLDEQGTVWRRNLETGEQVTIARGSVRTTGLRLGNDASAGVIALAEGKSITLQRIGENRVDWRFAVHETGGAMHWGPACLLVSDRFSREVLVVEGNRINTSFRGHQSSVVAVEMAPGGRLAFSLSTDGIFWAWDTRDGSPWLEATMGGAFLRVHENGRSILAEGKAGQAVRWELEPARVFREFTNLDTFAGSTAMGMVVSADGKLVATVSNANVLVWDTRTRARVDIRRTVGDVPGTRAVFTPDNCDLYISRVGGAGIFRRNIAWQNGVVALSEPVLVPGTEKKTLDHITPDGETWFVHDTRQRLWRNGIEQPIPTGALKPGYAPSPRARFGSPEFYGTGKLVITDLSTGRPCAEYQCGEPGYAKFSDDESWLVLSEPLSFRIIDTSDWQVRATWPAGFDAQATGYSSVCPSSRLAALEKPGGCIDLITLPGAKLLVTLEPPVPIIPRALAFAPDGSRIYMLGTTHRLFEWDLTALLEELTKLGLAW